MPTKSHVTSSSKLLSLPDISVETARFFGWWTGSLVFAFLFLYATMSRRVNAYDEGLVLFGSYRVMSGELPYRDFYTNYGPGQFYIVATLFKLFGPSVIVERLWDLAVRSITISAIYLIVSRVSDRKTALLTIAVVVVWLAALPSYGYPVFPCLLFSLSGVYFAIPVYEERNCTWSSILGGLCGAMAGVFRHDVGALAVLGGISVLCWARWAQEKDIRGRIAAIARTSVFYLSGVLLIAGPVYGLLVAAVPAHDILVDLVRIPMATYVKMRSLPFPSLVGILHDVIHREFDTSYQLIIYFLFLGMAVGALAALRPKGGEDALADLGGVLSIRRWVVLNRCVLTALFYLKGVVRVSAVHVALSKVPAIVVVCVLHRQGPMRHRLGNTLRWLAFSYLALSSLPALRLVASRCA